MVQCALGMDEGETQSSKKTKKTHWGGGLRLLKARMLAGWPCCCSGIRAEQIKKDGVLTNDPKEVTCKRCLANMRKAG